MIKHFLKTLFIFCLLTGFNQTFLFANVKSLPKSGPSNYASWFAESEMKRFPEAWQLDHGKRLFFGYTQGLGTKAMLRMYDYTGEKKYLDYVKVWMDSLINEQGKIQLYDKQSFNIDFINSGKTLLDIYKIDPKEKYRLAIEDLISQLNEHPRTSEGGFWHKKIYPWQIWLDGIYMGSPFMAQYGQMFQKPEWIDEAIHQVTLCFNRCKDEKSGLLHHAWDESKSQRWANILTGQSKTHWGRSMGWYFMAVVDVLDFVPVGHPRRNELIAIVKHLAEVLPLYKDRDGLWYQVLDQRERAGNYAEASVNTQFMYAYAKAVNKKYIDKKYRKVAEETFNGLKKRLLKKESDGTITLIQCCAVAGLGGNPYRDGSYEYYINEKIRENDGKATGPFIMACIELHK
jgi:unsaturated rhamnogalacturonyl hydrolase